MCASLTGVFRDTPKESNHACKFHWRLTLWNRRRQEDLWFACEGTGVSSTFFAVRTKQSYTCVQVFFFKRKLGYVLDGQPTVMLRVSATKR